MSQVLTEYTPQETFSFPSNIRFNPDLTCGEKIFLAEIQSLSKNGNSLYLEPRALCKAFGVSHQTIINWVKNLSSMGFLEVECKYANHQKVCILKSKAQKGLIKKSR